MSRQPINFTQMNRWSRWIINSLILFHFGAVGLSYATNWRRSNFQDRILVLLQPYLIGWNWYQEMLPVEWISDANSTKSVRVDVQTKATPNEWHSVLDTSVHSFSRAKIDRFLYPLVEFAKSDDTEGLTRILKSLVVHLESETTANNARILKIRLENVSQMELESNAVSILYEASLARFPTGEFGFVTDIESYRSVRAVESAGSSP